MNMNFKMAFDKLGVPEDQRMTIFRYGERLVLPLYCKSWSSTLTNVSGAAWWNRRHES
jgi:hypothetical protein